MRTDATPQEWRAPRRDQPLQFSGYSSAGVDRLMDSAQIVGDRRAALPLWSRYQRLIARASR